MTKLVQIGLYCAFFFYIYITFMHLADAFIQSDLLNIQD